MLVGKRFAIYNESDQLNQFTKIVIPLTFCHDRTIFSDYAIYDKATFTIKNESTFIIRTQNGCESEWTFVSDSEAIRSDKPQMVMKLAQVQYFWIMYVANFVRFLTSILDSCLNVIEYCFPRLHNQEQPQINLDYNN